MKALENAGNRGTQQKIQKAVGRGLVAVAVATVALLSGVGVAAAGQCIDSSKVDPNAICPRVYDPVCGCDGQEYSNACEAYSNGVMFGEKGACKQQSECSVKDSNCGPGSSCIPEFPGATGGTCTEVMREWEQVASTGVVDEGSLGKFEYKDADAYIRKGRTGQAILRYPIECRDIEPWLNYVPLPSPAGSGPELFLRLLYKDDGHGGRVRVTLRRTDLTSGTTSDVVRFDSDEYSSLRDRQLAYVPVNHRFDCDRFAYHLDASLERKGHFNPVLTHLSLETHNPKRSPGNQTPAPGNDLPY